MSDAPSPLALPSGAPAPEPLSVAAAEALVDELPPWPRTLALALQHVLSMYAGAVAVPLLVGAALKLSRPDQAVLISADLFTCGVATLLQTLGLGRRLGVRLPVLLGVSFVAVGPMISIGRNLGLPYVYGAIIGAGLLLTLLCPFLSTLRRLFPPVVTGSVVTLIGTSLAPVAVHWAAGGLGAPDYGATANLGLAALVLLVITAITYLGRRGGGFLGSVAVLIGLGVGTLAALVLGRLRPGELAGDPAAPWLAVVTPFRFGWPRLDGWAVLTMSLVALLCSIESMGVFLAVGRIVGVPVDERRVARGLRAEGLAMVLGGCLNSFPYTTFSQNAGLVALTGVRSRFVVAAAGGLLLLLGALPRLAGLFAALPKAVLGGAGIALFGTVAASGVRMLAEVDFRRSENLYIVACALGLGLGVATVPGAFAGLPEGPLRLLCSDGIVIGSLTAVLLNLLLGRRASASPQRPDGGPAEARTID
jgi:xanthine permease